MTKKYNEEFKKQLVNEYLNGSSYPSLEKMYGVAKSTISGWVKKYSEECQYTQPHLSAKHSQSINEIHELNKKIAALKKETLFLKKAVAFFAKEIDSWCIDLLIIIRNYLGFDGFLETSHYLPILTIIFLKIERLSIKNNDNGFMRK